MMYTCIPGCADPAHRHRPAVRLRNAPTKTAAKPKPAASAKVVRDRKGRSLRIDLHCHYLNPAISAKVSNLNASQFEPSGIFANALSKEVNVKQMQDRGAKLSTIEVRLKDKNMGIELTPAAKTLIAKRGYDPVLGARPLRRALQRDIEDLLAEKILFSELKPGDIVVVDVADPGSENAFTFTGNPRSEAPDVPPIEFGGIIEGYNDGTEAVKD